MLLLFVYTVIIYTFNCVNTRLQLFVQDSIRIQTSNHKEKHLKRLLISSYFPPKKKPQQTDFQLKFLNVVLLIIISIFFSLSITIYSWNIV